MPEQTPKKSFFISYTGADIERAKWVTKTLEDNGYTAIIQARDFLVGTHFPQNMDEALKNTEAVLTIVSARYLSSDYCRSEWLTAYRQDRTGGRRYIIPVRVEEVVPEGMLARNIYIDIFGDMDEDERKKKLLLGMKERLQKLKEGEESDEEQTENFWKNEKTVKSLPYCRNGYFTGREKTLADLQSALLSKDAMHPIQVIAGLGGVGKTEIALEFCYRNLSRFHTVWWMPAEDTIGLDTAYKKLGDAKGILSGNEKDADEIRETVRGWLENNPGYLLIYDNVENTKALSPYLPREIPGSIIITSRDVKIAAGLEQEHQTINIDVFDAPDAALFLVKRARKAESAGAEELAQRLGLLSLALEHAAAYILANNISFADYLALLEKSGLEVFNASEDKNRRYMRTVNSTWRISIAKIKNQSAEQMLNLCAYLASEKIMDAYFESDTMPSPLKDDMQNALKKNAVIRELTRYSLITEQITPEDDPFDCKYYSVHRLMQETIRNGLKGDIQYIDALFNYFDKLRTYIRSDPDAREIFDQYLPHLSAIADHMVEIFKPDPVKLEDATRMYNKIGIGLDQTGRSREAVDYYKKIEAVKSLYEQPGEEHVHTAVYYNNLGGVYNDLGLYNEAYDYAEKALEIFKRIYGAKHINTAEAYNTLAVACNKLGKIKEALKYYKTALKIHENQKGEDNPEVATIYSNMAGLAAKLGGLDTSLELYEKALAIELKIFGQGHPDTGITYRKLGDICMYLNQNERARDNFNKALAIFRVTLGLEHHDTGYLFHSMGYLSHKENDDEKAREWYAKALKIFDKAHGREHPYTANLLESIDGVGGIESLPEITDDPDTKKKINQEADGHYNKAEELEDAGDTEGAIREYTQCLQLMPNDGRAYIGRAFLYKEQEQFDLAIADLSEVLKIYNDESNIYVSRAELYEEIEQYDLALADYSEALKLAPDDEEVKEKYETLAEKTKETADFFEQGIAAYDGEDYAKAAKLFRKAADIGNADAQNWLGFCYENGQGVTQNYKKAVELYRKAAEQGNAAAQYSLGNCYFDGNGVPEDLPVEDRQAEAVKWWTMAAEQGDDTAQNDLGYAYREGQGVKQDYAKAFEWFDKAAEQGSKGGMRNMGKLYRDGLGVKQDFEMAEKFFNAGIKAGDEKAKAELAKLKKMKEK
jgi:TPR repeat protein/predicted NBD/HSP70 family sugar kinase